MQGLEDKGDRKRKKRNKALHKGDDFSRLRFGRGTKGSGARARNGTLSKGKDGPSGKRKDIGKDQARYEKTRSCESKARGRTEKSHSRWLCETALGCEGL